MKTLLFAMALLLTCTPASAYDLDSLSSVSAHASRDYEIELPSGHSFVEVRGDGGQLTCTVHMSNSIDRLQVGVKSCQFRFNNKLDKTITLTVANNTDNPMEIRFCITDTK